MKNQYDYYKNLSVEKKKLYIQRAAERKRELRKDPIFREQENERRKKERNTEEYRAKRRAQYALKHINDPMTPHRKIIIEAMQRMVQIPLEERRKNNNRKKIDLL